MSMIDVTPEAPSQLLAFLEPMRAMMEFATLSFALPSLATAPHGDGHPVIVIPGFLADDNATLILRSYLRFLGYECEGWRMGYNLGHGMKGVHDAIHDRVIEIVDHSSRKVSLVGWSLGGVMARRIARERPHMVRQVITLGAPFAGDPRATSIRGFFELVSGEKLGSPAAMKRFHRDRVPPEVPTTSIYSRTDGITAWQNCLEQETETTENIEISGSHSGLMFNASALQVLAKRLAEPEGAWRRHDARGNGAGC